jgi:hypothetical protein
VFKKNQYGPTEQTVVVRYTNGLFLPVPGVTSLDKIARDDETDRLFLKLLERFTAQSRAVSHKLTANNNAPKEFAQEDEAKAAGVTKDALAKAMRRLFSGNKIAVEEYGPGKRNAKLAIMTGGSNG